MNSQIIHGDCRAELAKLPAASFDCVATDPPYEFDFMGKAWDRSGVAFDPAMWEAVLGALAPAGYMVCFGGTRTYHRLACAVEDAGFEIRDCLMWIYGTGFPKGKGTLKPAYEPILLCRNPGKRVLPLGIDACRVPTGAIEKANTLGRYPANVLHDGSDEVMEAFAAFGEKTSGSGKRRPKPWKSKNAYGFSKSENGASDYEREGDTGTAARFFYCAKASKSERGKDNKHPTVKPLELMRWLVRLVCPPGGRILDPFAGSGTSLLAAEQEGRTALGIEQNAAYVEICRKRLAAYRKSRFTIAVEHDF